jgi:acrylyl-CoA reductase (NADPH)
LPSDRLDAMAVAVGLADVPRIAREILKGEVRGRIIVDVNR